jgi:predicted esterase
MRSSFFIVLSWISVSCFAQLEYHFTKGMVISDCHRYGREALVVDQLAFQLNSGRLKTPSEGSKLFSKDGKDITWKSIEVDSAGKFQGEALGAGYIYLTYESRGMQRALLNISGNVMVYVNGEPHTGDIYGDGWMNIPVALRKGKNEFFIRCGMFSRWQGVRATLHFPNKSVMLSTEDLTLPHIVVGQSAEDLFGGIVIINNTEKPLKGLTVAATLAGNTNTHTVADLPKRSIRKVMFKFDARGVKTKGELSCVVSLKQDAKLLDEKEITVTAVDAHEHQSHTFISEIDGSVQYYSVAPPTEKLEKPALFLSVHGAGVQAIGQARAYQPKDWGVLVAPTNRRPRGFNWEDWGRMDALEVLEIAKQKYNPDPAKIFLTGHSMGGHGTWYLGATYPDKWAAIAPCAGYPTLTAYGSADGKIPATAISKEEEVLRRASNPSDVIQLARNYDDLGVYVHHGDDDQVVSVDYARQMRKILGEFHNDFSYYEYPGGSHWFGNESVDWPPIFEFFKWHAIEHDSVATHIQFKTANPGISAQYRWASIIQQRSPLAFSNFDLIRDNKAGSITGTTENVRMLMLHTDFATQGDTINISIDSTNIKAVANGTSKLLLTRDPEWKLVPGVTSKQKNPKRSGTFKESLQHRMVFVYGTHGSEEENAWSFNKARYDAEVWYYRGNGAVDIIADNDFTAARYKERGVVIYGNSVTNSAWNKLLRSCPIAVTSSHISLGSKRFEGNDLGAYFTWPRDDSDKAMVAVVAGTGLIGMKSTDSNQYFAAGSGFPDYFIFSAKMLDVGAKGIMAAGFFNNNWELE